MTFWNAAFIGVGANIVWQLAALNHERTKNKCWPWRNPRLGVTIPSFIYSSFSKLVCAFFLSGFAAQTNQISGPVAAAVSGMVADNIVMITAERAKKGYKK